MSLAGWVLCLPARTCLLFNVVSVLKSALLVLDSQTSMSSNVNVLVILMISIFLCTHEFLRETWKIIWVTGFPRLEQPVLPDCSQDHLEYWCLFSRGWNSFCRICLAGGPGCKQRTGFLFHLRYQVHVVSCSASEHQSIHL